MNIIVTGMRSKTLADYRHFLYIIIQPDAKIFAMWVVLTNLA